VVPLQKYTPPYLSTADAVGDEAETTPRSQETSVFVKQTPPNYVPLSKRSPFLFFIPPPPPLVLETRSYPYEGFGRCLRLTRPSSHLVWVSLVNRQFPLSLPSVYALFPVPLSREELGLRIFRDVSFSFFPPPVLNPPPCPPSSSLSIIPALSQNLLTFVPNKTFTLRDKLQMPWHEMIPRFYVLRAFPITPPRGCYHVEAALSGGYPYDPPILPRAGWNAASSPPRCPRFDLGLLGLVSCNRSRFLRGA